MKLPPEKGQNVGTTIDESKMAESQEPVAEIELDEFKNARRDPRVHEFLKGVKAYGKKLKREQRINPTPAP